MTKTSLRAVLLVLSAAGTASAGGSPGTIGVGAEFALASANLGLLGTVGIGGVSVNYDAGDFHVGGLLGFSDDDGPDNTDFAIAGRFFYHVGSSAMADFGLGGNVAFYSDDDPNRMRGRDSLMYLEPGFQIRAFVASNVALSFTGGIVIGVADAAGIAITGHATGSAGVHYYFF